MAPGSTIRASKHRDPLARVDSERQQDQVEYRQDIQRDDESLRHQRQADGHCARANDESAVSSTPLIQEPTSHDFKANNSLLNRVAYLVTKTDVKPPKCKLTQDQQEFLRILKTARTQCVEFRRSFTQNPIMRLLADPIDDRMRNWHSLAIMFDWEHMDTMYGKQVFRIFLRRIDPTSLEKEVVLHFGDFFDSICGIVARSKSRQDIVYVAGQFGSSCHAAGLLPHTRRFLRADKADGHLIARTFSLPIEASLIRGQFSGDSQGGIGQNIRPEDIEDSHWKIV